MFEMFVSDNQQEMIFKLVQNSTGITASKPQRRVMPNPDFINEIYVMLPSIPLLKFKLIRFWDLFAFSYTFNSPYNL